MVWVDGGGDVENVENVEVLRMLRVATLGISAWGECSNNCVIINLNN